MIPEHLSYSQISDVLTCGEQYRLSRVLEAPKNPCVYLIGGSVVHTVTHCVDVGWPDLDVTGDEVQELCRKAFKQEVEKALQKEPDASLWRCGGRGGSEDLSWWYEQAPVMVGRWLDFRRDGSLTVAKLRDGMVASEIDMTIQYGGKPFKLAIDRIMVGRGTDERAIVDIKTGSREPSSPYQLAFYRDAAQMVHGIRVRWGYYWMARTGKLSRPFDLDQVPYELTSDMAKKAARIIKEELFIPNIGMFCGSCQVRKFCRSVGGDPSPLEGLLNSARH